MTTLPPIRLVRRSPELLDIRIPYTTSKPHPCYRLTQSGRQRIAQRWHVQTGTYKEEFQEGAGWAVERIVMPKSLGGVWLRLTPTDDGVDIALEPAI